MLFREHPSGGEIFVDAAALSSGRVGSRLGSVTPSAFQKASWSSRGSCSMAVNGVTVSDWPPAAMLWLRTTPTTSSPATTTAPDIPPQALFGLSISIPVGISGAPGIRSPTKVNHPARSPESAVDSKPSPVGIHPSTCAERRWSPSLLHRGNPTALHPPTRSIRLRSTRAQPIRPKPANGSLRLSTARSTSGISDRRTSATADIPCSHSIQCPLPFATWSAVSTRRSSTSSPEPTHRVPLRTL